MTTASIGALNAKLKGMIGKTYVMNAIHYKIHNCRMVGDKVEIVTDRRFFDYDLNKAAEALQHFMEVAGAEEPVVSRAAVVVEKQQPVSLPEKPQPLVLPAVQALSDTAELKDIVMDNIKQLKSNSAYIPQAQAINESIKVLVEMAKTEIQYINLVQKK